MPGIFGPFHVEAHFIWLFVVAHINLHPEEAKDNNNNNVHDTIALRPEQEGEGLMQCLGHNFLKRCHAREERGQQGNEWIVDTYNDQLLKLFTASYSSKTATMCLVPCDFAQRYHIYPII